MSDFYQESDFYSEGFSDGYADYYPIDTPLTSRQSDFNRRPVALARSGLAQQLFVPTRPAMDPIMSRMLFILIAVVAIGGLMLAIKPAASAGQPPIAAQPAAGTTEENPMTQPAQAIGGAAVTQGQISPLFTREVQHWAPKILEWSQLYGVEPNMAATIMQIESCGDPQAISSAGAMSLFQVMPFHFTDGENGMDPDTNARRGFNYFADRLIQTNGDVGRAFAGYNGGHVAAAGNWDSWVAETQRYYTWSTGIYADAAAGLAESATLQQWLAAGGAGLCQQAASRLGL